MKNAVLTLAEVLALPDGAEVWVDISDKIRGFVPESEGEFEKRGDRLTNWTGMHWRIECSAHGRDYRVWLLPQPPTAEELAANPWLGVQYD